MPRLLICSSKVFRDSKTPHILLFHSRQPFGSGSFVYLQQGGQPQTSRITHLVEGGVEKERLEMLEGAPVVVVRSNDEVKTYLPDSKTILIEKRRPKPGW